MLGGSSVRRDWSSLAVDGVSKAFGGTVAVREVTLEVGRGQIVGLIGPNGSGKTTLLNIISGVVAGDTGTIRLDQVDISTWSMDRRARAGLARTFQNLRLFQRLSVLENVAVAVAATRSATVDINQEARSFLELVGLTDVARLQASTLPYADQRRLELARALASGPSFVFVDEPTAGMSDTESLALGAVIAEAVEKLKCGVLCIAHDVQLVSRVCHFVYVLQQGNVIASGNPAAIRSNPLVVDAYLGRFDETSIPAVNGGAA